MAINATNESKPRELIPAGNYVARCYQMLQIGTVMEEYMGEKKPMHKVRIGWELPTELKVFDEAKGEQPLVISQEYTLSMGDKANLRKMLASWRGKDFTEDEAKCFDITALLSVPCMLNIIHKPSKDNSKMYQAIGSISPMPKGMPCPPQINQNMVLQYDNFDHALFNKLPDFLRTKIQSSMEYSAMINPQETHVDPIGHEGYTPQYDDDLPF